VNIKITYLSLKLFVYKSYICDIHNITPFSRNGCVMVIVGAASGYRKLETPNLRKIFFQSILKLFIHHV